ncbi:hypothetical protein LFWB_6680 [Candidatus Phytoplasma luffae]|uniref:Uncharacterized protein n=2 Tax=Loofah witches'-broom phytoplasma TaxID=35773 RepID=A0A975IMJ3_LOWBP|nr:hypothetical protein LFWB_6680 [Candidatus Phytoplasma luffae]
MYYQSTSYGRFPTRSVIPNEAIYQYFKNPNNWYEFPKFCPTCLRKTS